MRTRTHARTHARAGTALFESLFDDPEYEKVSSLGRISAQMEMYREDFLKETRGFIDIVLEAHGLRGAEVTAFMQEIETGAFADVLYVRFMCMMSFLMSF